jgi:hypothetical protein
VPNALRPAKSTSPDALLIALVAGDSGLTRRGLSALARIRARQREIMRGSRGALVKVAPREQPPMIDFGQVGADSPLTADFHTLLVLELTREFPESAGPLRALLAARRGGLDLTLLAGALWRTDGDKVFATAANRHKFSARLMSATLWVALKPLYEGVAAACARHFDLGDGGLDCPACGGTPWAVCGEQARCAVCETVWPMPRGEWVPIPGPQPRGARRMCNPVTGQRVVELGPDLFPGACDFGPFIELLRRLESAP